jgi:putative transposase
VTLLVKGPLALVEESTLPVRRTVEKIGIPHATFYRWYDRYQGGGPEALDDRCPRPDRISEASVYRLLKAYDLIASPAFIVVKAADEFKDKRRRRTSFGKRTSPI